MAAPTQNRLSGFTSLLARRYLRSFYSDTQGATAIEFGLILLPFLTIVFAIIETALSIVVNRMVDNAVVESARLIRTGQAATSGFSAEQFAEALCSNMPSFLCQSERFVVDVSSAPSFSTVSSLNSLYDEDGNLNEDHGYSDTCASEIVAVNVIYKWPMFTSLMNLSELDHGSERHLSSRMVFRNEPWNTDACG